MYLNAANTRLVLAAAALAMYFPLTEAIKLALVLLSSNIYLKIPICLF